MPANLREAMMSEMFWMAMLAAIVLGFAALYVKLDAINNTLDLIRDEIYEVRRPTP
jgi:hypothetical protein